MELLYIWEDLLNEAHGAPVEKYCWAASQILKFVVLMHMVWKSRGRVREVFAKFWEGGYIGVVKILGGGYNFLVFYCIFINKFAKFWREGTLLSPPVCIYGLLNVGYIDK